MDGERARLTRTNKEKEDGEPPAEVDGAEEDEATIARASRIWKMSSHGGSQSMNARKRGRRTRVSRALCSGQLTQMKRQCEKETMRREDGSETWKGHDSEQRVYQPLGRNQMDDSFGDDVAMLATRLTLLLSYIEMLLSLPENSNNL